MKAIAELAKDALELPASQRLQLARILIDVSEADQDFSPEAETAWEDEIRARIEAVKSGTARSRLAADVFADLDRQHPA
jgi:hypothetical protein